MNTANDFGRILRQLREDNDLTQEQLCNELELKGNELFDKSTISRWENGTRKPKIEIIKDLEEILGTEQGKLLRAAGYIVETSPGEPVLPQVDYVIVKQRAEHFTDLANAAKSLLINGLGDVSHPGWSTNRSLLGKYFIPNENAASGYDEITKEQLTSHLNNNRKFAISKHGDWFFRYCFIPHLKSELPEELKARLFYHVVEEQPYQLIKTLQLLASRRTFKGTCPVCEDW